MKKNAKSLILLATLAISIGSFSPTVYASSLVSEENVLEGQWKNTPPSSFAPKIKQMKDTKGKFTWNDGRIVNFPSKEGKSLGTLDFSEGGLYYSLNNYIEHDSDYDEKHFFIGSVEVYNRSSSNGPLYYQQAETVTTTWTTTGRVGSEGSLATKLLSTLKLSVGFDVAKSVTNTASSTVAYTLTVPPQSWGAIDAYNWGAYSEGVAVYRVIDPNTGKDLGKYEEPTSAWAVRKNKVYFDAYTWK